MNESKNDGLKNWPLIGNGHIIKFLEASIINGKIVNSYIFLGPENLGKTTTAKFFAKSLFCQKRIPGKNILPCGVCVSCRQMRDGMESENGILDSIYPDYHLLKKPVDKKNISVEQVRDFIRELNLSSFSNSYKIGVIKNADSLSDGASNALLKTLEEPNKSVVIILIVSSLDNLLPTIVSRSQVLNFYPIKSSVIYDYLLNDFQANRDFAKNISRLSLGRPALALKFLKDKDFLNEYMEKAEVFLDCFNFGVSEKFSGIDKILSKDDDSQELVKNSLSILGIWRALMRDLLLMLSGNENLIQHEIFIDKLNRIKNNFKERQILELDKKFIESEKQIKANVNPKLVLENFLVNI